MFWRDLHWAGRQGSTREILDRMDHRAPVVVVVDDVGADAAVPSFFCPLLFGA